MKRFAALLGTLVTALFFFFYGMSYLLFHQTKISDEEILIGRIGAVPFTHTEYVVNVNTGDEVIAIYSLFDRSLFINYGGECRCITKVQKIDSYYVSRIGDGQVYYSTGKTVHKKVPYEQERHKFEEGLTIRNTLKERYAGIISS